MRFKKVFSKRVLAGLVALTTISATSSLSSSATINSSMQYKIFRNSSGSVTSTYTLSALTTVNNSANSRGITSDGDNRSIDANKGVVRIVSTSGDSYTGFVIGEDIIATAASNVYNISSNSLKKISTISLYDEDGNVTGSATASYVHLPTNYTSSHLADYDYALIQVNEDLSSHQAFELGVPLNTLDSTKRTVKVTGFPDKINGSINTNSYTGSGAITTFPGQTLTRQIGYQADVTNGQQGSPVYINTNYNGSIYNTVIAINISADSLYASSAILGGDDANCGIRVTTDMLHFYNNNPNL